jgi:hypothetical protein
LKLILTVNKPNQGVCEVSRYPNPTGFYSDEEAESYGIMQCEAEECEKRQAEADEAESLEQD